MQGGIQGQRASAGAILLKGTRSPSGLLRMGGGGAAIRMGFPVEGRLASSTPEHTAR